ncbi:MAG: geranylgeranyl reductase family protein [Thermodesulfovibrionia bacterium]|nr:geranylgeranyl reductase family protein [Thermodesulfovibrionia bacterium]
MFEPIKYDVIIAGGGPAGSTAGYILAKAGLSVLLIDKSVFPRKKLCAGLITHKTVRLLKRVFNETTDSLKEIGAINFESDRYEILHRNESLAKNRFAIPYYFVERFIYDDFLLNKAKSAGVVTAEGEGVTHCDLSLNEVTTDSGRTLKAKFIIGADGVHSSVRKGFPHERFNKDSWQYDLGTAIEITVDRSDINFEVDHPMVFFGFADYGYAWIFPNRERLVIGICGLNRKNKKKGFVKSFHDFLSEIGMDELKKESVKGYPLPFGNFLLKPFFGNALLTGDAAGFADPIFGEGIFYAQRSGELAARAIIQSVNEGTDAWSAYHALLQKHILPEMISAKRHHWFFYNRLQKQFLKIVFNKFANSASETVHGIRSHRGLRKLTEGNS